jgi:hypothetical protein
MTASVFRGFWWEGHRDLREWVILSLPFLIPGVLAVVLNYAERIQENFWIRQTQNILIFGFVLVSLVLPLNDLVGLYRVWGTDAIMVSSTMVISILLPFWSQATAFILTVVIYAALLPIIRVIGSSMIIIYLMQVYDGNMIGQIPLVLLLGGNVWWSMKRWWKQWGAETRCTGICVHFIGIVLLGLLIFVASLSTSTTIEIYVSEKPKHAFRFFGIYIPLVFSLSMQILFARIIACEWLHTFYLVQPLHAYNPYGKRKIGRVVHTLYCVLIVISISTSDLVLMTPVVFELCIRIGRIIEFTIKRGNHLRDGPDDYIDRMYIVRVFQTIWDCIVCIGEDVGACFTDREQPRPNEVPLLAVNGIQL